MSTTTRRMFVAGSFAVLAAPLIAEAQQVGKVFRLACLWAVPDQVAAPYRLALEAGLRERGWVTGKNVAFEHRFPESPADFPKLAASIVAANVDVVAAMTNPAVDAMAQATTSIPIVMVYASDPVSAGFATSLARPGKNITGLTLDASPDLLAKQLQLLKEMLPRARRVQVLRNPDWYGTLNQQAYTTTVEKAARALGLTIFFSDVRNRAEIEQALRGGAIQDAPAAVYAMPELLTFLYGPVIADFAAKRRLPTLLGWREAVEAGGLASYGPNLLAMPHYAASFVDRLFRGARASELPIEQPTRFELVVNMKTAKALGLTIPPSLLLRADQVIDP